MAAVPETEPRTRGPVGPHLRRAARELIAPVAVFVTTRLVQLLVLAWMTPPDTSVADRLLSWDGGWFVRVASEGYPDGYTYDASGNLLGNGLAFLPGFPWLVRIVAATGLPWEAATLTAAALASLAAAALVYLLGKDLYGRRVGIALVFCVAVQPMAIVLSMGYSEALFLAFAAGALLAVRREAWLTAGLCAAGACLTRVVGVAVVAALAVALLRYVRRALRGDRPPARVWWRAGAGLLVSAVALPLYWWWVDARVGDAGAWFAIQNAGWQSRWDFGAATFDFLADTLHTGDGWVAVSTAVLVIVCLALLAAAALARPWPPLFVYGAVIIAMALGTDGYYHSKVRLLVPALVVCVPVARALARSRPATAVPVAVAVMFVGAWYGAHMVTVWHYAI